MAISFLQKPKPIVPPQKLNLSLSLKSRLSAWSSQGGLAGDISFYLVSHELTL